MVYGNPYLPSQKNGWKARKRPQNDLGARFLFVLVVLFFIFAIWVFKHPIAQAKTIELRDCRTNAECLQLYCAGGTGYVQDSSLTKLCHG